MKRKNTKYTLLLIFPLLIAGWVISYSLASGPLIPDENLEAAIRQEINYPKGEIRPDQLVDIQHLRIREANIDNLDGIQHFTSLISLDLRDNNIGDVSLLSELTRLESLNLRGNNISNIEALSNLTSLRELNLRENNISDISPLSGLYMLQDLNLRFNIINNIEALSDLESLRERLYLEGNPIQDLAPIVDYLNEINDTDISLNEITPVYSHSGGFYDDEFLLEISTPINNSTIYYTLDGSEPDPLNNPDHTYEYLKPILISNRTNEENIIANIPTNHHSWENPPDDIVKGTVVRSVLKLDTDNSFSKVSTQSYFINKEYSMPVISIATNSDNFFDDEKGIYVPGIHYNSFDTNPDATGNYYQRGMEWERPIHIEYYDSSGSLGFSLDAGARIHGGFSRRFPRKSLRIYARNDYGQNTINYPVFQDTDYEQFKRLILRQSGNDWARTLFNDALMQNLVSHMKYETQSSEPSIVFINGEYWGIHNIRERYDHHYFNIKYNINREDLVILQNNANVHTGNSEDNEHYKNMLKYIETNDLAVDCNRQVELNSF